MTPAEQAVAVDLAAVAMVAGVVAVAGFEEATAAPVTAREAAPAAATDAAAERAVLDVYGV